ncbi:hypothetical protein B0H67DRAFT_586197 [Lasiosphaeris hirsuta]|uniref:Uncharacterized protein n=1 Tax=Lasiosphaeris hirsuta TaxID=260670 RepID=A0AA40DQF7_9PEZI|nr:hypothetical protein B0H67DRAFT_586197 [Lasiosphaeris hirsuta]
MDTKGSSNSNNHHHRMGQFQRVPMADEHPSITPNESPPSYEASVPSLLSTNGPPTPSRTATRASSSSSNTLSSSESHEPLQSQRQYRSPEPMGAFPMSPARRRELESTPGCCFSTRGGRCFSDMGGFCCSQNDGAYCSNNGGCCFSDTGGCCCSSDGAAYCSGHKP